MSIRNRYIRSRRPKNITLERGVCGAPGCQETRLGPSGFCLKNHHSAYLRNLAENRQEEYTRGPCACRVKLPTDAGLFLRVYQTVECLICGHPIFDQNGKQLHTIKDVVDAYPRPGTDS